jgi:hypothetical protein
MENIEFVRWSPWPSLLCYAISVGLRIGPRPNDWRVWTFRWWLAGWILLVSHVLIAMGLAHHWSLTDAMGHTARQTQAAVGWNWGGGVWLNFATVAVWGWTLLLTDESQAKKSWLTGMAHCYLAFMMLNATVVFGSRAGQLAGMLICAGLLWRYLTPERPR